MFNKIKKGSKKFDKWVEKKLKAKMQKLRVKMIDETMSDFQEEHPHLPVANLRESLEEEFERVFAIAYKSIVVYGVQRANLVLLFTALVGTLVVVLTHGVAIAFLAPCIGACAAWIASVATIPKGYETRLEGGLDSVIVKYVASCAKNNSSTYINNVLVQSSPPLIRFRSKETCLNEPNINPSSNAPKEILEEKLSDAECSNIEDEPNIVRWHMDS